MNKYQISLWVSRLDGMQMDGQGQGRKGEERTATHGSEKKDKAQGRKYGVQVEETCLDEPEPERPGKAGQWSKGLEIHWRFQKEGAM